VKAGGGSHLADFDGQGRIRMGYYYYGILFLSTEDIVLPPRYDWARM